MFANGSMSSNQSGEGEIRKALIEAGLVDCMVALPGQLFYSTEIPACLWFIARDRRDGKFRDRRGHILFIDTRTLGRMVDRTHRELTDEDVVRIAGTYRRELNRRADLGVDIAGVGRDAMAILEGRRLAGKRARAGGGGQAGDGSAAPRVGDA